MELEAEPLPEPPVEVPRLEPTVPPPEETVSCWRKGSVREKAKVSRVVRTMEHEALWELTHRKRRKTDITSVRDDQRALSACAGGSLGRRSPAEGGGSPMGRKITTD